MGKNKPDISTDGATDSPSQVETEPVKKEENKKPEFYSPIYLVGKGETTLQRERRDGKKTDAKKVESGKTYSSRKTGRVEITVPGAHIIFEPLSSGKLPEEICTSKQFKEALAAHNIQESKS